MMEPNQNCFSLLWLELIEEGISDGSIQTEYAKEIAEIIPLLGDVWLYPVIYPATEQSAVCKGKWTARTVADILETA